ncbi:MAG TPA: VOC family protein [Sphingomonas sp.]|nr:VOC family protein [Sphingomonas sp.]
MDGATRKTEGIHHVGLSVSALDEAASFFCDLLGFRIVRRWPDYPALAVNDGKTTLTLWRVASPDRCVPFDRRNNEGLHHLALGVESPEQLAALHRNMVARAVAVEFAPELRADGGAIHMMCNIPGGPRLELVCPI